MATCAASARSLWIWWGNQEPPLCARIAAWAELMAGWNEVELTLIRRKGNVSVVAFWSVLSMCCHRRLPMECPLVVCSQEQEKIYSIGLWDPETSDSLSLYSIPLWVSLVLLSLCQIVMRNSTSNQTLCWVSLCVRGAVGRYLLIFLVATQTTLWNIHKILSRV